MRRTALLGLVGLVLPLAGCTGFGEFLNHTFTPPGAMTVAFPPRGRPLVGSSGD